MNFRKTAVACGILAALCVLAAAQTRASRRNGTPRPTAPATDTSAPPAPRIISTTGGEPDNTPAQPLPSPTPEAQRRPQPLRMEDLVIEQNSQRRSLNRVAGQLEVLTAKIGFLEAQQRQTFDLQRLMYAEQRADNLRKQLLEVQSKELELQTRYEQVEYELRPEIIDRMTAFSGSTRPEEARELRRKMLESEKKRLAPQLELLKRTRERLELAVPQAETEIDRLREQVDKNAKELREKFENAGQPADAAPAKPKPTPSPETNNDPPR